MITPTEIRKKAENKFSAYLRSIVEAMPFEPIVIVGNKKPGDDTAIFEKELTELIAHSVEKKGYGYVIEYQSVRTRQHGLQDIPASIRFDTERDYLKFIGKEAEVNRFKKDLADILSSFPELKEWAAHYPNKLLDKDWDSLLKVCKYFKEHPEPQLYIRELPIRIHTKFIEQNRGIIKELLDIVIAGNVNTDVVRFEERFGLKYDEPTVRFRILDKSIGNEYFSGVLDLSVPIGQFERLSLPIHTVYIVENKMNMLTFPLKEKSIVVWGHGFGVDVMKDVGWMKDKRIFYWGDLDAQGFQILSEARACFSQIESFLMDRETFDTFFEGDEGMPSNVDKELILTEEEKGMFLYLKENNYRLEQEKIPYDYVTARIPG